jgi:perosamine synthetase
MLKRNIPTLDFDKVEPYLRKICKTGWVAQGELVKQFEDDFCKYLGLPKGHAIAVSSGTAALFMALKVLGIKPRERVNLASYTCSAALNAILMAQAKPVLIDSRLGDFNCDYPNNSITIVTHTFGVPCCLPDSKKPIIEDCAAALGATINGQQVGTMQQR